MDRASIISVLEDTKQASNRCLEFLTEDDASYYTFKERVEAIDMAIAALREQEQSKWVSVKERLPEHGKRVLATDDTFVGEAYLSDSNSWYRGLGFRWINLFDREVTHWTPLPEPSKEGADHD